MLRAQFLGARQSMGMLVQKSRKLFSKCPHAKRQALWPLPTSISLYAQNAAAGGQEATGGDAQNAAGDGEA